MNKVILTGRITRDLEPKYTQDQKAIVRFSIAVDRRSKEKGADFISCVAFDKTAESMSKYLSKGSKIAAYGRIQTGSYQDRDGNTVYKTEVVAEEVEFLDSAKETRTEDSRLAPDDSAEYNLPF